MFSLPFLFQSRAPVELWSLTRSKQGKKTTALFLCTGSFSILLEIRVAAGKKHFTLFFPISLCPCLSSSGEGRIKTEKKRMKSNWRSQGWNLQTAPARPDCEHWFHLPHQFGITKHILRDGIWLCAYKPFKFLVFPSLKTGSSPSFLQSQHLCF